MEVVNIRNVTFNYPECEESAVKNINLKINEGEFLLIVGPSGCGKSTLIRLINGLVPNYHGGTISGEVYLGKDNIENLEQLQIIRKIGMVYQHPEKQIILQDVEREIAFGLENLNRDINSMKRNVAEVMSLLDLKKIKHKQTGEISGGEKQKIAIASVLSMDPDVIIFDEPISQLDPISADEVLNSIKKLNTELGKTIVLVEQRIDKCFSMADRVVYMENGEIVGEGTPYNIPKNINKKCYMPSLTYLFKQANISNIPVDLKEARKVISKSNLNIKEKECEELEHKDIVLEAKKIQFSYEKGKETLKDISFTLKKGEVLSVMGENGAGKSTLFKILTGLIDEYRGNVLISGKNIRDMKIEDIIKSIGYLSQNPNDYFGRETVFQEVAYTLRNIGEYSEESIMKVLELLNIVHLKDKNPRDLSGGEKQRVAIACTMVTEPDILILDEPTRGMDSIAKDNLGRIIRELANRGKSIVLITHDTNFAGDYAHKAMLLFAGEVIAMGNAEDILCDSIYYSPQVSRLFKNRVKVIKSQKALEILKDIEYEEK